MADYSKRIIPINAVNFTKRVERTSNKGMDYTFLKDFYCPETISVFQIVMNGDVIICGCTNWIMKSSGNIKDNSLLEIHRNNTTRAIRKSVFTGSYEFCDQTNCATIQNTARGLTDDSVSKTSGCLVPKTAKTAELATLLNPVNLKEFYIGMCYDMSCNLQCITCRSEMHLLKKGSIPAEVQLIHDRTVASLYELLDAGFNLTINISGTADCFASPLFSELIETFDFRRGTDRPARLGLITNGILMTEKRLCSEWFMEQGSDLIVSIDAATKHTYENVIRLNGKWDILHKNLEMADRVIGKLQETRWINFAFNYTVTSLNYHEMKDFITMTFTKYPSVKVINFIGMDMPHFMTDEEYGSLTPDNINHPLYPQFCEFLNDTIFDDPRVRLNSIASLRHAHSNQRV